MQDEPQIFTSILVPFSRRCVAAVLCAGLAISTTGCVHQLNQHATALSDATAPVVDQASAAYRSAEALHDLRQNSDAAVQFDLKTPVYNPRNIQPLLSEKDIQVRLTLLLAFQSYVKSLVEITDGTSSAALDAASKSVGSSVAGLGDTLVTSFGAALGIAQPTTSSTETDIVTTGGVTTTSNTTAIVPTDAVSASEQNVVSTATNALGQFLVAREIKKDLPKTIIEMDPHVQALCRLLQKDLGILKDQETRDYNSLINQQTQFIRDSGQNGKPALDPEVRRQLIMQLPEIVRQQHKAEDQLTQLNAALIKLAYTHHAFAAEAQGNNPESIKSKISQLSAAGSNLGKFYSSLPTTYSN